MKYIHLIIVILFVGILSGCGDPSDGIDTNTKTTVHDQNRSVTEIDETSDNKHEYYYERGKRVELKKIHTPRGMTTGNATGFYQKESGKNLGITDQVILKCKTDVNCTELLSQYQQSDISKISDSIYVIKVANPDEVFSLSRELYLTDKVEFAHPNFIKERKLR